MKIALFIADFTSGGAERVYVNLAQEFTERGHNVDLVIGNAHNAVYLNELPHSVRVIDLKVARMLKSLPQLTKYLCEHKPDVLMATRVHSCCFCVLAKILTRVKTGIVLREANTVSLDLGKYSWKRKMLLGLSIRILYPLSDAMIGVSAGVVNDLNKRLPGTQKKVHLVYSPIITDDLFAKASEPVNHRWFKNNSIPVILSAGRLTEQKKFDVLIRAFSIVRQKVNSRLLILGEGELRKNLEALVAELGLKNDVQLFGFDPNPFKFMAHSSLFVMSSAWEGLPGVLIQALACGCPVVSTDCPSGPREILKDGRLGKLVPVGDVQAMASAMAEALKQEPQRVSEEDLGEYTARKATDHYLRVLDSARKA